MSVKKPGHFPLIPKFKPMHLLWLLVPLLLYWTLRNISIPDLAATLRSLHAWQLLILFLINCLIVALFALRLWLIFLAKGFSINFFHLLRYWLAGFSFSYFTPGPQFGGGVVQLYFLHQRDDISLPDAASGVVSSQIIERVGNTMFLLFGLAFITQFGRFGARSETLIVSSALALIALPIIYFILLNLERAPIESLARFIHNKFALGTRSPDILQAIVDSERQLAFDIRERLASIILALLVTLVSWATIILQTWTALHFLAIPFSIAEIIALLTTVQIAYLAPAPAGLGFVEAGTVLAMETLGASAESGLVLMALVRLRDVFFGGLGLLLGGHLVWRLFRNRNLEILTPEHVPDVSMPE